MGALAADQKDGKILQFMREFENDRVGFCKHIIGITPTDQQGDALKAMDTNDHISIASGHGCGKSFIESVAVHHYMNFRFFPKIPCTAPSKHQLHDILWAEISKVHRMMLRSGAGSYFAHRFEWTKEKFFHKQYPEEWFAAARTATKENPEALQGFHADYVLRVIDEASGVPEAIFEVADGAHGIIETKELMCANPTRLTGTFYHSHHKIKDEYTTFQWSCLDSPIAPPTYARRISRKYGIDSNIYRVRVLGKFPLRDGDSFIPYDLVEDSLIREIPSQKQLPKVFGVDVARYGDDDTVIAIRQGDEFLPYHILRGKSTMETANYVAHLANKEKPEMIFIDTIGVGAGVFDRLYERNYPVTPVNVSESPATQPNVYLKLRDELWGNFRDWLEMRRGKLWDNSDSDLLGELTTPKYAITAKGLIVIESKDGMKKRLKEATADSATSPNKADAHIMTFAEPMAEYTKTEDDLDDMNDDDGWKPLDPEAGY